GVGESCAGGDGEGRLGQADPGPDGGGGQLHTAAAAGDRQAVPDADRGHLHDLGPGDGGDGAGGARDGEGRGRDRDRGAGRHAEGGGNRRRDVQEAAGRGAGGGEHRGVAAGDGA